MDRCRVTQAAELPARRLQGWPHRHRARAGTTRPPTQCLAQHPLGREARPSLPRTSRPSGRGSTSTTTTPTGTSASTCSRSTTTTSSGAGMFLSLIHIWQAHDLAELPAPRQPWLPELKRHYNLADRAQVPNDRSDDALVFGLLDEPEAVSYTHLDVYKRQSSSSAGPGGRHTRRPLRSSGGTCRRW